jgi:hypothetical protein
LKSELKNIEISSDGLEGERKKILSGEVYNMQDFNT